MNFDELVQLQVLKHKASLTHGAFTVVWSTSWSMSNSRNAPDVRQGALRSCMPR
jgi:hypothetical protein